MGAACDVIGAVCDDRGDHRGSDARTAKADANDETIFIPEATTSSTADGARPHADTGHTIYSEYAAKRCAPLGYGPSLETTGSLEDARSNLKSSEDRYGRSHPKTLQVANDLGVLLRIP